jgi:hypothetical protein
MILLSPDERRPIASLLLLTIVVISATGVASVPVIARAPPEPVCGVCTQALNQAADDHEVNLERGTSKMMVQVHSNGTATFTARVSLTQGADQLRNGTLRRAIVRDISYIVAEERRNLHTRINRTTLVVRYRAAVAHQSLGVVRFDAFETAGAPPLASGGEGPPYPGADTLVMRTPADYKVHNGYGDSANDTAILWYGDSHEQYAGHIEDDVVISFVPTDATAPAIRVRLATLIDWFKSLV